LPSPIAIDLVSSTIPLMLKVDFFLSKFNLACTDPAMSKPQLAKTASPGNNFFSKTLNALWSVLSLTQHLHVLETKACGIVSWFCSCAYIHVRIQTKLLSVKSDGRFKKTSKLSIMTATFLPKCLKIIWHCLLQIFSLWPNSKTWNPSIPDTVAGKYFARLTIRLLILDQNCSFTRQSYEKNSIATFN